MLLIYEFQSREHEKRKPATARMMGISVQSVDIPCPVIRVFIMKIKI